MVETKLYQSLGHITFMTVCYCIPIMMGLVDHAKTENGPDHYAEKPVTIISQWFPQLPMPFNTIVNFGYVLVGALWLWRTHLLESTQTLRPIDAYCTYNFAWLAIFYGPIQMGRILTQEHRWAIADQWATLPFFSWVVTWGLSIMNGWSWIRMVTITTLSIASYSLTQFTEIGFEIALAMHILCAVAVGIAHLQRNQTPDIIQTFVLALMCCSGFVVVKLIDHELPNVSSIFNIFSGHFLSKICDFMQIHYVAEFFYWVTQKSYGSKKNL